MTALPDAPWRSRPGMDRLLAALDAKGGATRFVGGCVRDALLGLEQSDVDLATRFTPVEVVKRLEAERIKAVPTGIAHGTITAVSAGTPVEVTTLRRDVSTDGRRATVAFTDDWRADAARRDFTINALSADPLSGEVFDYFGGLADLEARRVRFIGDPLQRIAEDHLRILRFFRFHARFGIGEPDAAGLEACVARANDLMALSRERIADELLKLLSLADPTATVRLMIERRIFAPVLPEIETADRLALLPKRELAAGVSPDGIRRLGALLPRAGGLYTDGAGGTASDIAMRLRLSNAQRMRLICIGRNRPATPGDARAMAYEVGLPCAIDRILLDKELNAAEAAERIAALHDWKRPHMPVSGGDLIAMGLTAGPVVAKTMQALEGEWIAAGFPADKNTVRAMARRLVDQLLRSSQ